MLTTNIKFSTSLLMLCKACIYNYFFVEGKDLHLLSIDRSMFFHNIIVNDKKIVTYLFRIKKKTLKKGINNIYIIYFYIYLNIYKPTYIRLYK